ncbi:hypothetical protein J6590_041246 [Homalodisca vitripennis]|nr:hypothetical protein J6590_041246 [Homalodisca vitripennis]
MSYSLTRIKFVFGHKIDIKDVAITHSEDSLHMAHKLKTVRACFVVDVLSAGSVIRIVLGQEIVRKWSVVAY